MWYTQALSTTGHLHFKPSATGFFCLSRNPLNSVLVAILIKETRWVWYHVSIYLLPVLFRIDCFPKKKEKISFHVTGGWVVFPNVDMLVSDTGPIKINEFTLQHEVTNTDCFFQEVKIKNFTGSLKLYHCFLVNKWNSSSPWLLRIICILEASKACFSS